MGAEHHVVARQGRGVNHLYGGDNLLQFGDAAFDEGLTIACRVILGVFAEVAVAARFGDGANDRGPLSAFQRLEFFLKSFQTGRGHREFLHCVNP